MRFVLPSAAKLNLSFRVTKKREDGYHDIVSLFLRLPPVETLLISKGERTDSARVRDVVIEGENIVCRALRCARKAGFSVPFFDVEIVKTHYPGSGLGAGSGNGAAILRWLAREIEGESKSDLAWRNVAMKTGADVSFLFSGAPLALVSGIGEIIEPLDPLNIFASVVFPDWSVETKNAYSGLDRRDGNTYPLDEAAARTEAEELLRKLRKKERAGLLPNDFAPLLMEKFPNYGKLFGLFERSGYCAWGITGSGGAAFALSYEERTLPAEWPSWVRQVLSADMR